MAAGGQLELVRELAAASGHLAVLCVTRSDGTVHASLVSAGVLPDPVVGRQAVGLVVGGSARKLALLRARPRATVVFSSGYRWVSIEGAARLEGPDDHSGAERALPETIRAVYRAAGGDHEDWEQFDRVMAEERRCAVFVEAGRILTN